VRHLAAAFEDHAFVDAQARGENVSPEYGWAMDFDAMLSADVSGDFAADDDRAGVDLTVDTGAFTHDEGVGCIDFPAERPTDANGALKAELSFKLASVIDHPGNLGIGDRDVKIDWLSHIL
jgi:hypothetical protein